MTCTLMHKKIAVAKIQIDEAAASIRKIDAVYAPEHLPIGVPFLHGTADRTALNRWWAGRSIPDSRSGICDALRIMEIDNTKELLSQSFGLSLSDRYWIRPDYSEVNWKDINFYENVFSEDVGDILLGISKEKGRLDFVSPDFTTDGNLQKCWKIIDGKRCLVKGGSYPYQQQPFNEVIASGIMDRLGIPHIPYTLMWFNNAPYSVCEDFISENTELVPAWRIFQVRKKRNDVSVCQHFVDCCEILGIKNVVPFLDRMIVLDYVIANEDRHLNNFGAVRDTDTLQWLGMAPVYDSGTSLGYDKTPSQIYAGTDVVCKPFKNRHEEQLKLVSSFDWIDFRKLADVQDMIFSVLSADGAADYIDENRIRAICNSVQRRIDRLQQIAATRETQKEYIGTSDDVEENIAADYSR